MRTTINGGGEGGLGQPTRLINSPSSPKTAGSAGLAVAIDKRQAPHVAQNTSGRRSAIDGRVTRHAGYALSQKIRKRIEEVFGWGKEIAGLGRTRFRGRARVGLAFGFAAVAYNLVRLPRLLGAGA